MLDATSEQVKQWIEATANQFYGLFPYLKNLETAYAELEQHEQFRKHGVEYRLSEQTKSDL